MKLLSWRNIIFIASVLLLLGVVIWFIKPSPTIQPATVTPPVLSPATATTIPTNPNENILMEFDRAVFDWDISPDDKTLVLAALIDPEPISPITQLWTLDLNSKQLTRFEALGGRPLWSPNGDYIIFQGPYNPTTTKRDIKIIDKDGQNEQLLISIIADDLVDYYWISSTQINLIKNNGIDQIDINSHQITPLNVLLNLKPGVPSQISSYPDGIVLEVNPDTLVSITYNGQRTILIEAEGRLDLGKFKLSPNAQQLAYSIDDGSNNEKIWIMDLSNNITRSIYEVKGHIHGLVWSPDAKKLIVGSRPTGTSWHDIQNLVQIDIESNQVLNLDVGEIDRYLVFNHQGNKLFYGHTTEPSIPPKTTLYWLEIK